jgi:hypothetical protein
MCLTYETTTLAGYLVRESTMEAWITTSRGERVVALANYSESDFFMHL